MLPFTTLLLALAACLAVLVVELGEAAFDRSQVRTAAEAAALAVTAAPERARTQALRLAEVLLFEEVPSEAVVEASVGWARATARARTVRDWQPWGLAPREAWRRPARPHRPDLDLRP